MELVELHTDHLLLRRWRATDRDAWAALCADPEVMRHFPATLDRTEADSLADRFDSLMIEHGWGLWAVEVVGVDPFIGYVGLLPAPDDLPCAPAIEVGWRLARAHWGHGYATEAAGRALDFAFGQLELPEVVSFTAEGNLRSRAVMERLGLRRDTAAGFEHPRLPEGHPLRRHVLYRIDADRWRFLHSGR